MAINSQKLLPQAKLTSTKVNVEKKNVLLKKELINIRKTLISIDKLLLSNSLFQRKATELKRKDAERQRFKEKETRLERKKEKEITKDDKSSVPQLGIFDRINRFITFTFLGFLFNKFSKYLPQVLEFSKKIQPIAEFIESFVGNVFNGIVDFIDFGYDAHKKVSNFAKQIGGENLQKTFDDFSSNLTKFINLAIIAGMATMGGTDFGLGKRGGKPGTGGGATRSSGIGNYLLRNEQTKNIEKKYGNNAARLYELRRSQGASQKRALADVRKRFDHLEFQGGLKGGTGPGKVFGRGFKNAGSRFTTKLLGKAGKRLAGKVFGRIPIIGGLVDFLFALWSGEPVGRAAAKGVGATIGSALGTFIPIPFAGTILGGILGDIVGGALYDTIVGNRPDRQKIQGRNRGGQITRGGRRVGGAVKRTVRVTKTPPKVPPAKPGESIGGKDNLQKIFPEPTGQQKGKTVNPYGFLTDTANSFLGTDIAGALGAVFIKPFLGQLPTKEDYKNFGLAMNIWISNAMSKGLIGGNATGGFADGGIISNGMMGDISKWAEKSIEEMIKNKVTDAINDLRRNLGLKELQESVTGRDVTTNGELAEGTVARGQVSIENLIGLAKGAGFSQSDAVIMAAIAMAESGGNSNAHNAKPPDNSYGLWQINMIGNLGPERRQQIGISSDDKLKDPVINAHAAKLIKNSQGFGAWTVYKTGAYKRFLPAAQAASSSPPITVYRPSTTGGFVPVGTEQGNLQLAQQIANSFNVPLYSHVRPNSGGYHRTGRAMDFSNDSVGKGTPEQLRLAQELVKRFGSTAKEIFYTPLGFSIKDGKKVPPIAADGHYNHVHVAFKDGGSVGFDKKSKNIGSLQNFPSYDQGSTFAILPIETIVTVPIQSPSQNKIAFTGGGGGVNSNDNNKSRMFVG
jgi:hypothetical protein